MTQYILPKKVITNVFLRSTYKVLVIIYSFYISFSAQALTLTVDAPLGGQSFAQIVFDETAVLERKIKDLEDQLHSDRIEKIRSYYAAYDLPLQYEAEHFVVAAEKYGIDWRLVAAIGFIESTGGKYACSTATYSAFGWGSCKINFNSYAESIDVISKNLGGHNPNTEQYYAGKDIRGILWSYNPDTIRAGYGDMVINQMNKISPNL